jgi:hypothetical protein
MYDLQIAASLVRCSKLHSRYFVLVFDRCRRLKDCRSLALDRMLRKQPASLFIVTADVLNEGLWKENIDSSY